MKNNLKIVLMVISFILGISISLVRNANADSSIFDSKLISYIRNPYPGYENPLSLNRVNKIISHDPHQLALDTISQSLGAKEISLIDCRLIKYALPGELHKGLDHSSFQPYMCYTKVRNKSTSSWKLLNSKKAYSDDEGFRRVKVDNSKFSLKGKDDYVVAMGNYYKRKGSIGDRFLIITTVGMVTIVVGAEKSDNHTDSKNMFTSHGKNKQYAGVLEWILDMKSGKVDRSIKKSGSVTTGPVEELHGKLLYIYKII